MIWVPSRSGRRAASSSSAASSSIRASRLVVRAPQSVGLGLVPGGAVGPGQDVQPLQLVAGVADVAADGGVGPLPLAVAVEAQVQLDQLAHRRDLVRAEPQRGQPLRASFAPTTSWWWNDTLPPGLELPGGRLADVVQHRSQPADQVRLGGQPRLQVDGLLEHGQAVLVHVLVPVVLVALQPQRGSSGSTRSASPVCTSSPSPGARAVGQQQLGQLVADPLGGHDGDPVGHRRHGRDHPRRRREQQLGGEPGRPHHPQRVVAERLLRRRRGVDRPRRPGAPGPRTDPRTACSAARRPSR